MREAAKILRVRGACQLFFILYFSVLYWIWTAQALRPTMAASIISIIYLIIFLTENGSCQPTMQILVRASRIFISHLPKQGKKPLKMDRVAARKEF
jgi:hypothetical protein